MFFVIRLTRNKNPDHVQAAKNRTFTDWQHWIVMVNSGFKDVLNSHIDIVSQRLTDYIP